MMGVGLPAAKSALVQWRTGQASSGPCDLCAWFYLAAIIAGRQGAVPCFHPANTVAGERLSGSTWFAFTSA